VTRKAKDYILIGVIVFLSICIAATSFVIFRNYKDINKLNDKIKHSQTTIEKQTEENNSLKQELEKSKQELETAKQEKATLESENANLKQEITELKAKKEAALKYANLPAAPQNPQPVGKICYLTFDDGPSDNTLKILEILNTYNVKATFFVTNYAQSKIEYVTQIHAAGHTIGLHTQSHNYAQIYSSEEAYFADLNAISAKVMELTGVDSKVIRFPGGGSNAISKKYCPGIMSLLTRKVTEMGYTYFDWNVSSEDASAPVVSASRIVSSVLNGASNKNSICVLMHDAAGKTTTVEALPAIIEGLRNQGYTFAPLTPECYGYHHKVNN
jgi:peptidoglycan/xylan/chitin deacetylase (PgdA/CDA1 family)